MSFTSERDIVKHFSMSSMGVRPEASALIFSRLSKISPDDHKKAYLDKMIRNIKDKQQLHSSLGNGSGQVIID